jgi:cytochrome c peroxidase
VIGEPQPWNGERNGENNFYDASLCFQEWQSCHSCHPLTRPDALNWILGGGSMVAPKNAKNMLFAWWTGATTWTGRRSEAHKSINAGIELELFRLPTNDLSIPLDTFFMALKPMASPFRVKGRLSEAAQRGKLLYNNKEKTDCMKCHPAPLFTDIDKYWNSGVPDPYDPTTAWKTPGLTECWRTGPYGHLGSYWTMTEILELPAHSNAYKKLDVDPAGSGHEMKDLVEYVLSL